MNSCCGYIHCNEGRAHAGARHATRGDAERWRTRYARGGPMCALCLELRAPHAFSQILKKRIAGLTREVARS